ncbi:porin, partial [uncultured Ralstonia sp.]|uniref:porin n=1 Tax=uncultured Ralstonia sp. TaxID=114715 RepID=UPI0025CF07B7
MSGAALRSLCAAAAVLACAQAYAQSGITLYGFLDVGVVKMTGNATQLGTIQRSNVGIKGTEDLGGGYAATFKLSSRFDLGSGRLETSGATPFFQDESTVGLSGPFGSVRLGRALTPMWQWDWLYDPWANFNRVTSVAWYAFHPSYRTDPNNNGPIGEYSRLNNGVFYDSPDWNGFHVRASVGVDKHTTPDANGNVDQVRPVAASLNYDRGPWSAMLTAERNSLRDNTWFAGVAYTIASVTLTGSYSQTHLSDTSLAFLGDTSTRRTSATLGASWPVTGPLRSSSA